jgi:hypothetical protein
METEKRKKSRFQMTTFHGVGHVTCVTSKREEEGEIKK